MILEPEEPQNATKEIGGIPFPGLASERVLAEDLANQVIGGSVLSKKGSNRFDREVFEDLDELARAGACKGRDVTKEAAERAADDFDIVFDGVETDESIGPTLDRRDY